MALNPAEQLIAFTCLYYGYPKESSVNLVRARMMKKMVGENEVISCKSKIDLACIPPYLKQVNQRVAGYQRAPEAIW